MIVDSEPVMATRTSQRRGDSEPGSQGIARRQPRRQEGSWARPRRNRYERAKVAPAALPARFWSRELSRPACAMVLTTVGDNPDRMRSEAAFAHLCGVAPIPASSGKTRRHRLNRGGDRAANNALYTVVLARLRLDERTRAYVARRTAEGLSRREIIRCLQRYVARELYHALVDSPVLVVLAGSSTTGARGPRQATLGR